MGARSTQKHCTSCFLQQKYGVNMRQQKFQSELKDCQSVTTDSHRVDKINALIIKERAHYQGSKKFHI